MPGGPVPTRDGYGDVGAGLLDAAQRQQHVRRVTDHLTLRDTAVAHRRTTIDLSLDLLTPEQRDAGLLLEQLRGIGREPTVGASPVLWVPCARLDKSQLSPLRVTTAGDVPVPLLTTNETALFVSAGMRRAVRATLWGSVEKSTDPSSPVGQWSHNRRIRWLLDAAVDRLVVRGERGIVDSSGIVSRRSSEEAKTRAVAKELLAENATALTLLEPLLDLAFRARIVVVGLDPAVEEQSLEHASDLLNVAPGSRSRSRVARRLARGGRSSYGVSYATVVPATISQYHVVIDVDNQVRIARSCLTSDGADESTRQLVADLRTLSDEIDDHGRATEHPGVSTQVVDTEIDATEMRASELLSRWRAEANSFYGVDRIPSEAVGGEHMHALLLADDERTRTPRVPDSSTWKTGWRLRAYANAIERFELGRDVRHRNDGIGDRRHLRWSPDALGDRASGDVRLGVGIALVDDGELRGGFVPWYLLILLALSFVFTLALAARDLLGTGSRTGENPVDVDSAVALLLLVPGFVFSRLNIADGRNILGVLRFPVRVAAYIGLVASVLQAVLLATMGSHPSLPAAFAVIMVLELVVVVWALTTGRRGYGSPRLPASVTPAWLGSAAADGRSDGPGPAPRDEDVDMVLRAPGA